MLYDSVHGETTGSSPLCVGKVKALGMVMVAHSAKYVTIDI